MDTGSAPGLVAALPVTASQEELAASAAAATRDALAPKELSAALAVGGAGAAAVVADVDATAVTDQVLGFQPTAASGLDAMTVDDPAVGVSAPSADTASVIASEPLNALRASVLRLLVHAQVQQGEKVRTFAVVDVSAPPGPVLLSCQGGLCALQAGSSADDVERDAWQRSASDLKMYLHIIRSVL